MGCKCHCSLIKWGKTKAGTVRWRCSKCGLTRIRRRHGFRHHLLSQYLVEGKTAKQLSADLGVHPNTIRNRLQRYFAQPPPPERLSLPTSPCWLVTDATHFKRWGCLFVTKATGVSEPLAVSFHDRKSFENTLEHLKPLERLSVAGFTTDGRRGLVLGHQHLFSHAVHQRCLIHIQMKVQTLLTQNPKLLAGRELLGLSSAAGKLIGKRLSTKEAT